MMVGEGESEFEPADPGADGEDVAVRGAGSADGGRWSHIRLHGAI